MIIGRTEPRLFAAAAIWICTGGVMYLILNQLRWMLDPRGYAIVSVLGGVGSIAFSVALVVGAHLGVLGVLVGGSIGNVLALVLGLFRARSVYGVVFRTDRLRQMLRFSLPLVPSGIAVFVTLYIDRIAISRLMTTADVGLFGIGYRLASVSSLLILGFQAAITPIVYTRYREPDAPTQLAGLFRAFAAVALLLSLTLAMFADEIIRALTTPSFYGGSVVVPILAPALLLSGMYVLAPGLAISRRTGSIALISIGGAGLNTVLNLLLIPGLGIQGAALATLLGAAAMFGAYMIVSQTLYPVPHEWTSLALATAGTAAIFGAAALFNGSPFEVIAELLGLLVEVMILVRFRLLEPRSIALGISALLARRTS